jgi:hypothetical protein
MRARRKPVLIAMVIILVAQLLGEVKTATGKLLIPTAAGEKPYNCVMVITPAEIGIECTMKIFQPFNQFGTPRQAKIKMNTAEIEEIQVQNRKNRIYIITTDSFCIRYRNVFNRAYKNIGFQSLFPITKENWALIFTLDNPSDIGAVGEELIKVIGERCEIVKD